MELPTYKEVLKTKLIEKSYLKYNFNYNKTLI